MLLRERLLAVDVYSIAERRDGRDRVPVIRSGDANRIDVIALDDVFVPFAVATQSMSFPLSPLVVLVDDLLRVVTPVRVDIAHRHHLGVVAEEVSQQPAVLFGPFR